jgi:hypothetical protein
MNIPAGCKPFDLQAALAGAKTIHRDGSPGPIEFHLLPEWTGNKLRLLGRITDGSPYRYAENGRYLNSGENYPLDLFMAPVEREIEAWAVMTAAGDTCYVLPDKAAANSVASLRDADYEGSGPHTVLRLSGKWKG